MAGTWLVQQKGRENFVTQGELKTLARGGKLEPGDLVYHPTLGRWLYAREVQEVAMELHAAAELGNRVVPGQAAIAHNDSAVAGFTLGVLGVVPVFGILCALIGLPLAVRGIRRSRAIGGIDRRFAIAGVALSLASLLVNGGATLLAIFG
ncbi:MAG: hypothetical protein EXR72_22135 [Myxococcales bacterium]|nr:hypothetical protein [Myxococcales bacterium]